MLISSGVPLPLSFELEFESKVYLISCMDFHGFCHFILLILIPLEIISKNNSKVQLQNLASFLVIVIKQTYTDAD